MLFFPGFSHSVNRVIVQIEVKTTGIRLRRSKEGKNLTFRFVTPQPRLSEINFWFSATLYMYNCWQDWKVYFNKLTSARLRDSESKYSSRFFTTFENITMNTASKSISFLLNILVHWGIQRKLIRTVKNFERISLIQQQQQHDSNRFAKKDQEIYNRKTLHFPSLTKEKKNNISLLRFSLSAIAADLWLFSDGLISFSEFRPPSISFC